MNNFGKLLIVAAMSIWVMSAKTNAQVITTNDEEKRRGSAGLCWAAATLANTLNRNDIFEQIANAAYPFRRGDEAGFDRSKDVFNEAIDLSGDPGQMLQSTMIVCFTLFKAGR